VRDVYDLGESLLIVSTDRISAFDWVLPSGIPSKGIVLTQLSCYWFSHLSAPNHLLTTEIPPEIGEPAQRLQLQGRSMLVKKAEVIPFECVVRGYLEGSGWREYCATGEICGIRLPAGLKQCDRLPEPIFTPATKATEGHDENVTFEFMRNKIGTDLAERLKSESLRVYQEGLDWAEQHGIIIADTKFEWGWHGEELLLVDEVLTPDSSRFWPAESYAPGGAQVSFDKQFVREWLLASDWDRQSEPPALPPEIIEQTRDKYLAVYHLLTGRELRSSIESMPE
jgi:phosphoribosylaminoimidazole-succinocarboxamide synthase